MASVEKSKFIWMNGGLVPWDEANVHVLAHTLHYGFGVFEGTRSYEQADGSYAVFRLEDHLERLEGSAKILNLELPYDRETLRDATLELLVENEMESCYVRHPAGTIRASSTASWAAAAPASSSGSAPWSAAFPAPSWSRSAC